MDIAPTLRSHRFALRHAALLAVSVGALLCLAGMIQHGLWAPDEPREAEIGREMLLSHWSAVPTLGGAAFLEKPPLFVWIMAAAYRLFGVSPFVARLPSALFSVGATWVAYAMGRRAGGRVAGLCAAAVLLTCNEFATWCHCAVNDTALTFFVAAGHLAFLTARDDLRLARRSSAIATAGACAGLAFLTKGFVGPVLLVGPPLLAAAALREWSFVRHAAVRAALWCGVFVAALGIPWVLMLAREAGWTSVTECLWHNTVGRTFGGTTEEVGFLVHSKPAWYYLGAFPASLLPWSLALPTIFVGAAGAGVLAASWRAGRARYLAVLALAGVVLLSIPAGKRMTYALPLFPAAAAVFGTWLSRVGSRRGRRLDRVTVAVLVAATAAIAALVAYVGAGGPIPRGVTGRRVSAVLSYHGDVMFLLAAPAAACAFAAAWLAVRSWRRPGPIAARAAAGLMLACFLLVDVVGRPLTDHPLYDLRDGALEVAGAVPADEEMFAVAPDETTIAAIAFYAGRMLRPIDCLRGRKRRPGVPPWRYLVVMNSSEGRVDEETRRHMRLLKTVSLSWDRPVRVYRYEPD